ncbi:MAG TPA: hypothetical protein DHW14_06840 [Clostridiales bacterium]|nr:hypothetical protein [Clostridiales bacterium]
MRFRTRGWGDPALAVLAGIFLVLLFAAAGGRGAFIQAATALAVTLDGDFSEWVPDPDVCLYVTDTSVKDEPEDQQAINFREDIHRFFYAQGTRMRGATEVNWLFFKVDRYPKPSGGSRDGIRQPIYYAVFIDYDNDHPAEHASPVDDPWARFINYDEPEDYVLYCTFNPVPDSGEPSVELYLVPGDKALSDTVRLSPEDIVWPTESTPVEEYSGDWGELYDRSTGTGGLSVEFGVPFDAFDPPLQYGQTIQFFLGATLNNPMNHTFYPQQDYCPNEADIVDTLVPSLGTAAAVLLIGVGLAVAYRTMRRNPPHGPAETG